MTTIVNLSKLKIQILETQIIFFFHVDCKQFKRKLLKKFITCGKKMYTKQQMSLQKSFYYNLFCSR